MKTILLISLLSAFACASVGRACPPVVAELPMCSDGTPAKFRWDPKNPYYCTGGAVLLEGCPIGQAIYCEPSNQCYCTW